MGAMQSVHPLICGCYGDMRICFSVCNNLFIFMLSLLLFYKIDLNSFLVPPMPEANNQLTLGYLQLIRPSFYFDFYFFSSFVLYSGLPLLGLYFLLLIVVFRAN